MGTRTLYRRVAALLATLVVLACGPAWAQTVRFAVIGDYGSRSADEGSVANLVASWNPDLVVTTGDNNYDYGEAATIDASIGQYYHQFIAPYSGAYGLGATTNRFFPSIGNHDYNSTAGLTPYLNYFVLPGNERYYEFAWGPVHFFVVNSDSHEPDGTTATSTQGVWLQRALAASTAPWKVVYFHHAPYSSGATHGSTLSMRWPFEAWGAFAVLAGHDHTYERLQVGGIPYFVNGIGGKSRYSFGAPLTESRLRYNAAYGAQLVDADSTHITYSFYNTSGVLIDSITMSKGPTVPTAPTGLVASALSAASAKLTWVDASSNEDGFTVQRSPDGKAWLDVADVPTGSTTYTNTGLVASTRYYYRIRAFNTVGASAWSNVVSVRTKRR